MRQNEAKHDKVLIFEQMPVPAALTKMAIPTIVSQLITLIYNMADTWFIGQTNNPYMVAASSLVLTVFMMTVALSNLFGVGGSSMMSRALGRKDYRTVRESSAFSFYGALICSICFSLLFFFFGEKLLYVLGADSETITAMFVIKNKNILFMRQLYHIYAQYSTKTQITHP